MLVLERRDVLGGCCVTEEIAPGCRASTTSYIASMLRPEVIRDLRLKAHGLRMVPCDPALQVPFPDGDVVAWWADMDRTVAELRRQSPRDAQTFARIDARLKKLARYLQPFFLEPPPDVHATGLAGPRGGPARGQALPRDLRRRDRGDGVLPDGQPAGFPRPSLRVREGEDAGARQQRLRQARRPPPAGHGPGPALSPALRGGSRSAGVLRPRDGRDGRDHAGDGRRLPRARRRAPDGGAGRPDRRAGRRGERGCPGGRNGDQSPCRAVERGPQAHVPGPLRGPGAARGVPGEDPRDQDGRAVRQGEPRPVRGAARQRDARGRHPRPARALHPRPVARVRGAMLRRGQARRDPGRALGRLRRGLERRPGPLPARPPRHDLLRPVRALQAPRGDLGREARAPRRSRGPQDRRVCSERPGSGRGAAGLDAARPREDLRSDGGEHLPRRPEPRPALLHEAGGRAGRAIARRCPASTCAARARIPAEASRGRPATTRRGRCCGIYGEDRDGEEGNPGTAGRGPGARRRRLPARAGEAGLGPGRTVHARGRPRAAAGPGRAAHGVPRSGVRGAPGPHVLREPRQARHGRPREPSRRPEPGRGPDRPQGGGRPLPRGRQHQPHVDVRRRQPFGPRQGSSHLRRAARGAGRGRASTS